MSDETIARLFNRVDDMVKEMSAMRAAQSRIEERLHYSGRDSDELKEKMNEALMRINNLEDEIAAFKWWLKGAYVALAVSASTLLWVLTRTGVIESVFGK
jgi:chromosome segregation ATPase